MLYTPGKISAHTQYVQMGRCASESGDGTHQGKHRHIHNGYRWVDVQARVAMVHTRENIGTYTMGTDG